MGRSVLWLMQVGWVGLGGIASTGAAAPLVSGGSHHSFLPGGDTDEWTFSADAGESIMLRVGQIGGEDGFTPELIVSMPGGVWATNSGGAAAGRFFENAAGGGYTVYVSDASQNRDQAGEYRLHFFRGTGPYVIGDEGGELVDSGGNFEGAITVGDLDVWSFEAAPGERLRLRIGEMTDDGGCRARLRLFSPDGRFLDQAGDSSNVIGAGELSLTATNRGTYRVVVADSNAGLDHTDTYRIHFVRTAGPFVVADDGGPLTNDVVHEGGLWTGDLDPWSFVARAGDTVTIHLNELTDDGGLLLRFWLYGPDGLQIDSKGGGGATDYGFVVTNRGPHLLMVGDGNAGSHHTGTYSLSVSGVFGPIVIQEIGLAGGGLVFSGSGGVSGASFVLVASTNVTLPMPFWEPVLTNQFGTLGTFIFTNGVSMDRPYEFFRLMFP